MSIKSVTDGTHILMESGLKNQLLFFREDRGELIDVDIERMQLLSDYLATKILQDENSPQIITNTIVWETSADNRCMKVTIIEGDPEPPKKEPSMFKKIGSKLKKVFN